MNLGRYVLVDRVPVLCDGGCSGGVHRYCGHPELITEYVVATAERNTQRLRRWCASRRRQ